jgi:hypothetical protein
MATTTMTTTIPPPPCHFNTLSGELRNRIYSYLFRSLLNPTHQTTIDIREDQPRLARNAPKTRSALALTAVSHQCRAETLALFWSHLSLRIVSGTLSAYSQPIDSVPSVHPMNRAHHINQDRAECLREWLESSGVARFAKFLMPVELDLGMWDPQSQLDAHQFRVLRLLGGDTLELTRLLQGVLGRSKYKSVSNSNSGSGGDNNNNNNNDNDTVSTWKQAGCILRFKVQVMPSTALGSICVANERKQALASIAELCEGRAAKVEVQFRDNILTPNGRFCLLQDMAMCRSLAEVLVQYIVEEEQVEEDDDDDDDDDEQVEGGGQVRKRKTACKRGQQGGA